MKVTAITVESERKLSDGNYGVETARVVYSAELEEGEDREQVATVMLALARAQVVVHLRSSPWLNIRRAANERPRICTYCNKPVPDESAISIHQACSDAEQERRRLQREAEIEARHVARMAETAPSLPSPAADGTHPPSDEELATPALSDGALGLEDLPF